MERSSKRGKIPQQDWPSIIKRYEAGETLASIARTYDCSPPAISYILSRTRTRDLPAQSVEARLIETQAAEANATGNPVESAAQTALESPPAAAPTSVIEVPDSIEPWAPGTDLTGAPPDLNNAPVSLNASSEFVVTEATPDAFDPDVREPNRLATVVPITVSSGTQQLGESRRTLHLSISNNGDQSGEATQHNGRGVNLASDPAALTVSEMQNPRSPPGQPPYRPNGGSSPPMVEAEKSRATASLIDRALRERVESDISAFLAAFDAALADDTAESRAGLREATDRLLRAGARTRIELERLEARMPLSARRSGGYPGSPAWRQR